VKATTFRSAAEQVIGKLHQAGFSALLAGGCVRDILLGIEPKDYDVATSAPPQSVVKLFRRTEQVGARFGVVLVRVGRFQVEVATFRTDGDYQDGRHPDSVEFGSEAEDAKRRDFTINGMFCDIRDDRIIDHVGGREDLERRLIRAIGQPDRRFAEDHLRMLRAVRFAARLEFTIEPSTMAAIQQHAGELPSISAERIREELKTILTDRHRSPGWRLLVESRLSDHLIPGILWNENEAESVGHRLDATNAPLDFMTALAALLLPFDPVRADAACRSLACSNQERKGVRWLLEQLPRVHAWRTLELADIKLLSADDRFDQLLELMRIDLIASGSGTELHDDLKACCDAITPDQIAPPPLVTGDDLITRNVPAGPLFARTLDAIYRAQLNGDIASRDDALAMLEELLRD
jgi:poly(A) polymerase